ncbi:MAG: hypothetical protein JWM50_2531 [Microbacteriaceae bacterium]|nr:hypothetical protein [Microbacteriaceae bacterium]
MILLAASGGSGVAIAMLVVLGISGKRRRLDDSTSAPHDEERADALRDIQADIDRGNRGY